MRSVNLGYRTLNAWRSFPNRRVVDYDIVTEALGISAKLGKPALYYKGEYRQELARESIHIVEIALDRRKKHNSINALISHAEVATAKYGSSYWLVSDNTGGIITNVTIYFSYDTCTILGSYGTQYVDSITIPRMEAGQSFLVPFQFQMATTASGKRLIGKPAKVTYTDANNQAQTAYTNNPVFIVCNARPKIRSYTRDWFRSYGIDSQRDLGIPVQGFIPFAEIAGFQSAFSGIYVSYWGGQDPTVSVAQINSWTATAGNWANIMYYSDANNFWNYTSFTGGGMINKLDPATELGIKPITSNENVNVDNNDTIYYKTGPVSGQTLVFAHTTDATNRWVAFYSQNGANGWRQLFYWRPDAVSYTPYRTRDYACFAAMITQPLFKLGLFTSEVAV